MAHSRQHFLSVGLHPGKPEHRGLRTQHELSLIHILAKGRTLAFQVSEELFQRVKEYLERFEKVHHRRLTQKEFIIGLIEQALEEAEEEFEAAEAAGREEQEESAWAAAQGGETGEDEGDPSTCLLYTSLIPNGPST